MVDVTVELNQGNAPLLPFQLFEADGSTVHPIVGSLEVVVTTNAGTVLATHTTGDGSVVVTDAPNGKFTLQVAPTDTATPESDRRYHVDEVTGGNRVTRMEGPWIVVSSAVGGPPTSTPNPWISSGEVFDCGGCRGIVAGNRNLVDAQLAAQAATEFLFENSRRQFSGLVTKTVRPSSRWHERAERPGSLWSNLPEWTRWRANVDEDDGYRTIFEVGLIGHPVVRIESVYVDGSQLASSAYRVDDFRWLVRTDGTPWPSYQDLALDARVPGNAPTFEVTFTHGRNPPGFGIIAARDLACELYKGLRGDDCAIPDRVVNMVRQGTTFALIKPADFDKGRTGVRSVDLFLATWNPKRRGRRATIVSPDVPPRGRRVGT